MKHAQRTEKYIRLIFNSCNAHPRLALKISRKKLVRVYNAHGLLKKIVVGNARIKYQSYIFFSPLSFFILYHYFLSSSTINYVNLRSDPEFKLIFTDAVLDFESITQHPDNKNII
jgi:hypothetical protein